jgi:hypothetical protein
MIGESRTGKDMEGYGRDLVKREGQSRNLPGGTEDNQNFNQESGWDLNPKYPEDETAQSSVPWYII